CHGYGLVEAPRVDAGGNLYFSDVLKGGVYRRAAGGTPTTGGPERRGGGGRGAPFGRGGGGGGRGGGDVRGGGVRVLLGAPPGVRGFNDLITDAAGRVLVGSLRSSAFERAERVPGELWRIGAEGRAAPLYGDVAFANGVGLSPDGRTVYHSNYSAGEILAHDLTTDGAAINRRVLACVPRG